MAFTRTSNMVSSTWVCLHIWCRTRVELIILISFMEVIIITRPRLKVSTISRWEPCLHSLVDSLRCLALATVAWRPHSWPNKVFSRACFKAIITRMWWTLINSKCRQWTVTKLFKITMGSPRANTRFLPSKWLSIRSTSRLFSNSWPTRPWLADRLGIKIRCCKVACLWRIQIQIWLDTTERRKLGLWLWKSASKLLSWTTS